MRIETERLIITELTAEMAPDVYAYSLDEDNRRFVPDEVFETPEEAREAVAHLISGYGDFTEPQVYAVTTRAEGRYIGYVQLVPMEDGTWEIGYHIGAAWTGKGYATEAVLGFLPAAAEGAGIREVYGICLKENAASRRVLEKSGFRTEYAGPGDYQGKRREIVRTVRKN